ncbi:sensor histidine kinase inhibitor, KipI family [Alteromonadaceae bacterium Bs31]|nr:sensor histidine kinase inhibitor, KipI family [Alteromonadaceae bacterium Bs31]
MALAPAVQALNDNTLLITFGDTPSEQLAAIVGRSWRFLKQHLAKQLINAVPASTTLLLEFKGKPPSTEKVESLLSNALMDSEHPVYTPKQHIIPVLYDPDVAPDLNAIMKQSNLNLDQLIELHTNKIYRVFALGFMPGFAFLGEVDKRIAFPRMATPRVEVAAGSVGIAENITGIYPRTSPGGWHIIGRCPLELSPDFLSENPTEKPPSFSVGDEVQFTAIQKREFESLLAKNKSPLK